MVERKQIVLVHGMHRSGTSAITNMISHMGFAAGDNLYGPDTNNEKGYFEDRAIVDLNTKILFNYSITWNNVDPWISIFFDSLLSDCLEEFSEQAETILDKLFKNTSKIVIKDPRMAITLQFWNEIFKKKGIELKNIFIYRNPLNVATSLNKRDGMSISHGKNLWYIYNYMALANMCGDAIIIDYDQLVDSPDNHNKMLCNYLGVSVDIDNEVVSTKYRHNNEKTIDVTFLLYKELLAIKSGVILTHESISEIVSKINSEYLSLFVCNGQSSAKQYRLFDSKSRLLGDDRILLEQNKHNKLLVTYDLSKYGEQDHIRFDPSLYPCIVQNLSIIVKDEQGEILDCTKTSETYFSNENIDVFTNRNPYYIIMFNESSAASVEIECNIYDINPLALSLVNKLIIKRNEQTIANKEEAITHNEQLIEQVKQEVEHCRECWNKDLISKTNRLLNTYREKNMKKYRKLRKIKDLYFKMFNKKEFTRLKMKRELLECFGEFDFDYYLGNSEDVNIHKLNAKKHFVTSGYKNGLCPSKNYNMDAFVYMANQIDSQIDGECNTILSPAKGISIVNDNAYAASQMLSEFNIHYSGKINGYTKIKFLASSELPRRILLNVYKSNNDESKINKFLDIVESTELKEYEVIVNIEPNFAKLALDPSNVPGEFIIKDVSITNISRASMFYNKLIHFVKNNQMGITEIISKTVKHVKEHGIKSMWRRSKEIITKKYEHNNKSYEYSFDVQDKKLGFSVVIDNKMDINMNKMIENQIKDQEYALYEIVKGDINNERTFRSCKYNNIIVIKSPVVLAENFLEVYNSVVLNAKCRIVTSDENKIDKNGDEYAPIHKSYLFDEVNSEILSSVYLIKKDYLSLFECCLNEALENVRKLGCVVYNIPKIMFSKRLCEEKDAESVIKPIAFYLPQFHPTKENNEWWGEGFTEWVNTKRAVPMFDEHYQPHEPGELGFYDLLDTENIQVQQAELAKQYGIYGFCYYYYWFEGKQLLEKPLEKMLKNPDVQLPFCICWANETWSRRWDGQDKEILIKQVHNEKTDVEFIYDAMHIFKDGRYIYLNDKPMLLIYRASLFPNLKETIDIWNKICIENGFKGVEVVIVQSFGVNSPEEYGANYAVQFPPHNIVAKRMDQDIESLNENFDGYVFDYKDIVEKSAVKRKEEYNLFKGCMLSWDNTARRMNSSTIFHGANPNEYKKWLTSVCDYTNLFNGDNKFVFINAWNEWAEGTHLEPDQKYGRKYLETTKQVLSNYCDTKDVSSQNINNDVEKVVSVNNLSKVKGNKKKEVYLHIGIHKTATTSIQDTMLQNIDLLNKNGFYYPKKWKENHGHILGSILSEKPDEFYYNILSKKSPEEILKYNYEMVDIHVNELINTPYDKILISGEGFSQMKKSTIIALKEFYESVLGDVDFKVVVCFREHSSYAASAFQQSLKTGRFSTTDNIESYEENLNKYVFKSKIEKYIDIFGNENIIAYKFEEACKYKYGPVGYFIKAIGLEDMAAEIDYNRKNESVSFNSMDILNFINKKVNLRGDSSRYYGDTFELEKLSGNKYKMSHEVQKSLLNALENDRVWLRDNIGVDYTSIELSKVARNSVRFDDEYIDDIKIAYSKSNDVIKGLIKDYFEYKINVHELSEENREAVRKIQKAIKQLDEAI